MSLPRFTQGVVEKEFEPGRGYLLLLQCYSVCKLLIIGAPGMDSHRYMCGWAHSKGGSGYQRYPGPSSLSDAGSLFHVKALPGFKNSLLTPTPHNHSCIHSFSKRDQHRLFYQVPVDVRDIKVNGMRSLPRH